MGCIEIKNLKQLNDFGLTCAKMLKAPHAVFLKGDLAVGKTQLVQFICCHLGVEEGAVSSPTFSLINSYQTKDRQEIQHVDLYRIQSDEELEEIAFWDLFYEPQLVFIEWPERVLNKIPNLWNKLMIELKLSKNKRWIYWKSLS